MFFSKSSILTKKNVITVFCSVEKIGVVCFRLVAFSFFFFFCFCTFLFGPQSSAADIGSETYLLSSPTGFGKVIPFSQPVVLIGTLHSRISTCLVLKSNKLAFTNTAVQSKRARLRSFVSTVTETRNAFFILLSNRDNLFLF